MRLCHLSDSHLGAGENHPRRAASGLTERQEDIIAGFVEAVDRIIDIRPDLCIHSGDLFHAVRPLNRIMAIAAEQLHRLAAEASIPTVIISGNHDAPRQPYVGAPLEVFRRIENLHIAVAGQAEILEIAGARICALPHCISTESLKHEMARCRPSSEAKHNVLVMHGVAAGMPEFSMADLGEQEIPLEIMDGFDYVALGHYHNFRQVSERAWYAGSTERLSQGEREAAKGFVTVELDPFAVQFQEVRAREMISLPEIDAAGTRGDQLAQMIKDKVEAVGAGDKIVRLKVRNVSPETLNTLPAEALAELKRSSYALDVSFEKAEGAEDQTAFGRSAIGQLDKAFAEYLDKVDLSGFDKERLLAQALNYLKTVE
jgi:DNA repair exonuclease SbcCD nuclease subunit